MRKKLAYSIGTALGVGYSPIAPGTAGSLLALVAAYYGLRGHILVLLLSVAIIVPLGIWAGNWIVRHRNEPDPSLVVVDEVAGMWIALLGVPHHWAYYLLAFLFFRIFDVLKPPPVAWLERYAGGVGIMLDDVAAGGYSLIAIHVLLYFWI